MGENVITTRRRVNASPSTAQHLALHFPVVLVSTATAKCKASGHGSKQNIYS